MPSRAASEASHTSARTVEPMRFRRAPLLAAGAAFAIGIGVTTWSAQPFVLLLAALTAFTTLALVSLRLAPRTAISPVLAAWLVLGMLAGEFQPSPAPSDPLLVFADNLSRTVEGRVIRVVPPLAAPTAANDEDAVPPWESTEDTASETGKPMQVDLEVNRIERVTPDISQMVPVSGVVRIAVYEPPSGLLSLACGERLRMPLRLRTADTFRDPGVFQYATLLGRDGITAEGSVTGAKVDLLGASSPTLPCRLRAAQAWSAGRLFALADSRPNRLLPAALRLNQADAAMLAAMLFGDRRGLSHSLRIGFERTGSFHLFVVSGLHLALLAGGIFLLLKRLRAPNWLATTLTLALATVYAAVTGFGDPVMRALVMTAVFLLARLLGRDRDPLNALGAALLALLVLSPRSLFEASLQMTALAVLAIAGIAAPLGRWTVLRYARVTRYIFRDSRPAFTSREDHLRILLELWGETLESLLGRWGNHLPRRLPALSLRALLWTGELALVGTVAELVMTLPMALYFHRVVPFALPANLLVIPLIGLLLPAAVLTFVLALLSPWLAALPAAFTAGVLHLVDFGIDRVSHLHAADLRVPGPALWVAVLAIRWAIASALALPLIALGVLWPESVLSPAITPGSSAERLPALEITAIDVGQGDSILAVSPAGRTMLIDAGGPVGRGGNAAPVSSFDIGEEVVSPYLWSRRLRRLDVVALTHAHTDHMGGMPAILRNFRPRELWVGIDSHSPLYTALLQEAAGLGVRVRHLHAGDNAALGDIPIRVLAPAIGYSNPGAPKNDDSLVLEMTYGKASVLLEGDAERPSEDAMLASKLVHPVTLLKVGHHGSKTSSNPEFLAAAAPREAVVSVGRRNTFGHPRADVIARFAQAGTRLYRTDRMGLSTFLLHPDGSIDELPGWP
jgi:competence protein ComEC